jgi:hypothetical protein
MSNSVLFFWCFAGLITGAALGFIYGVVWGKSHVTVYETQHRDDIAVKPERLI